MFPGLISVKRLSGGALALIMAAALAACDTGQIARVLGGEPMDGVSPPAADTAASMQMGWTWDNANLEGWTLSGLPVEVTWPAGGGVSLLAPSTPQYPDIWMRSPPLSFPGREFPRIVIDLETIVPGVEPDLSVYYTTANHGEAIEYRGVADDGSLPEAGERRLLVYNMADRAAIAEDWNNSTILSVRFDLPQGARSHHIVHSIRICHVDDTDCG